MKVKSKAELRGEIRALVNELLGQADNRVSDSEIKLHRIRKELLKAEAELNNAKQYRTTLRAYLNGVG